MQHFIDCFGKATTKLSFAIASQAPVLGVSLFRLMRNSQGDEVTIPSNTLQTYECLIDTGAAASVMPLGFLRHFYEPDQIGTLTLDGKTHKIPKEYISENGTPLLTDTGLYRADNTPIQAICVPLRLMFEDATGQEHTLDEKVVFSPSAKHCLLGRISFFEQLGLIFMNDPTSRWFGLFNLR